MPRRFRTPKAAAAPAREPPEVEPVANAAGPLQIDRAAGIIRGVSAIQIGEALGHDLLVDAITLRQVVDLGNAAPETGKVRGIKSRFTHPGMCADGLGTLLGHATNFRVIDDKAVCDLTLIKAAATSPKGDLFSYVLDLAEQAPESFGLSIVFCGTPVWIQPDGSEIAVDAAELKREGANGVFFATPPNATTTSPVARVEELEAVDAVDEPAANEDGLFSSKFSGTSSTQAAQAFAWLDEFRGLHGLSLSTVSAFSTRYLAARGFSASAIPLPPEEPAMSPALLKLASAHHSLAHKIIEMLGDKKPDTEIIEAITAQAFAAEAAKVTALTADVAKITTELATQAKAHQEALGKVTTERDALAAQVAKFKAFERSGAVDPGSDPAPLATKGPEAVKAAWNSDAQVRTFWKNDYDGFAAAADLDGLEAAVKASKV